MKTKLLCSNLSLVLVLAAQLFIACGGPDQSSPTSTATPAPPASPAQPKTGFEADLDYVRKGQYTYIWVFSRKDSKPLDKDDGAYLRKNAPQVVDWVTTDEGKRVIAGTNFNLEEGNLGLLQKRFVVEDYTAR